MFHHVFNTLLYGMIGYALLTVSGIVFWGIRALRFKHPEVTADDLESTIRGWLYDSGLSAKRVSDPAWIFGLLTTLPDGESVYVIQRKESRSLISFEASLDVSPEHQSILKAASKAKIEKLMQEIALKVFLSRMVLTIRMRASDVSFLSKLAVTRGSMKDDFFDHLDDMDNAIILARDAISRVVELGPRLVDQRSSKSATR
jgi:hypothetical protein